MIRNHFRFTRELTPLLLPPLFSFWPYKSRCDHTISKYPLKILNKQRQQIPWSTVQSFLRKLHWSCWSSCASLIVRGGNRECISLGNDVTLAHSTALLSFFPGSSLTNCHEKSHARPDVRPAAILSPRHNFKEATKRRGRMT